MILFPLILTATAATITIPLPDGCSPVLSGTTISCAGVAPPPVPTPPPPAPTPTLGTLLPWLATNSRTLVSNCNSAGDTRTFYFTVPADAPNAHSITGSDYSDSIGNFRSYTLKEVSSGSVLVRSRSTAISLNFTFTSKFGYTLLKRGYTYTLEVVSDPTAPYKCNYYLDLNNG